jgi:DNA repair and recombination RAD54-like protein
VLVVIGDFFNCIYLYACRCGDRIKCIALSESSREKVLCGIADYMHPRSAIPILIISYETMRMHAERFTAPKPPSSSSSSAAASSAFSPCCDLLIADEAHRLKNAETLTYGVLLTLPCKRRVLLSGTPMQNNLDEFFAMADLVNPGVFGEERQFRKQLRNSVNDGKRLKYYN